MTVKSFGVGEGIINPSSYYSHEGSEYIRGEAELTSERTRRPNQVWKRGENPYPSPLTNE